MPPLSKDTESPTNTVSNKQNITIKMQEVYHNNPTAPTENDHHHPASFRKSQEHNDHHSSTITKHQSNFSPSQSSSIASSKPKRVQSRSTSGSSKVSTLSSTSPKSELEYVDAVSEEEARSTKFQNLQQQMQKNHQLEQNFDDRRHNGLTSQQLEQQRRLMTPTNTTTDTMTTTPPDSSYNRRHVNSHNHNEEDTHSVHSALSPTGVEIVGDAVSVITELTQSVVVDPNSPPQPQQQEKLRVEENDSGIQLDQSSYYLETNSTQRTIPTNNNKSNVNTTNCIPLREVSSATPPPPPLSSNHHPNTPIINNTQQLHQKPNQQQHRLVVPQTPLNPNATTKEIHEYYENRLATLSSQHASEIDSILSELNTLEETYNVELKVMRSQLGKREIMTDALTNSLTEMKTKSFHEIAALDELETENEELRIQIQKKIDDLEEWKLEVQELEQEKEELKLNAEHKCLDAVKKAREEIKSAAEVQFAQAQRTYCKLKDNYDVITKQKNDLQCQFDVMKKDEDTRERKAKAHIASLMAELAESRAGYATSQAEAMKLKQTYGEKMQRLVDRENQLEERLVKVERECKESHQLVGKVVSEKEELKVENAELQGLCEELMGIVEENGGEGMEKDGNAGDES